MNPAPEEERFFTNIEILIDVIATTVKRLNNQGYNIMDVNTIVLAQTIIKNFNKHYLIEGFIKNSHEKCWDSIYKRDEEFFIKYSAEVFSFLPAGKVDPIKDMFLLKDKNGKKVISQDEKDELWEILSALIKISIKYVHKQRCPSCVVKNDKQIFGYSKNFLQEVKLNDHAKLWGIRLDYPKNITI